MFNFSIEKKKKDNYFLYNDNDKENKQINIYNPSLNSLENL